MSNDLTTEQIARLSCLMDAYQMDDFLKVCEAVKAAGDGFGEVTVSFTNHTVTQVSGHFTRKPRRDQSALLRGGRAP